MHEELVYELVRWSPCETYLELGVYTGTTFNKIAAKMKRAIGVDIVDRRTVQRGEFYEESTDEFFEHFKDPVDVVFIDADHYFESAKKDFLNSLKLLTKNGFIIMHDTDPNCPKELDPQYCGDSYKMVDYVRENHPELDMVTLPVQQAGISFIVRKDARRVLGFI